MPAKFSYASAAGGKPANSSVPTSASSPIDVVDIASSLKQQQSTTTPASSSAWTRMASKGAPSMTAPEPSSPSAPTEGATAATAAAPPTQGRKLPSPAGTAATATSTPAGGVAPNVLFDYYVVLDFEATCEKDVRFKNQEVIEFPFVIVDGASLSIITEFQRYVKPVHNPTITAFCTNLTGIEQEWVDKATTFDVVFAEVVEFLRAGGLQQNNDAGSASAKTFAFVTCGDWDLKTMLPNQLRLCPDLTSPNYFYNWINLKTAMQKIVPNRKISGMETMLNHYKLPLVGRHHSGIDDCRNIAAVLIQMLKSGVAVDITTSSRSIAKALVPAVQRRGPSSTQVSISTFPPSSLDPNFGKAAVVSEAIPAESSSSSAAAAANATHADKRPRGGNKGPVADAVDRSATTDKDGRLIVDEDRDPKKDIPAPTGAALDPKSQGTFSRRLSSALRHKAPTMGLHMFKNGYVSLDELITNSQFRGLTKPVVAQIVRDCNKQRFGLVYGIDKKLYICANQGHSIPGVQSDFKVITGAVDAPVCIHGTNLKAWELIKSAGGLSPMGRLHIHFAKGTPGADGVISGMRNTADVLIYIDVDKLVKDGIPLWESANGVLLSSGDHESQLIKTAYFSKVINRKTGASLI